MLDTPRETISTPRSSLHFDESTSLTIHASNYEGYISNTPSQQVVIKEDNKLFEFYFTRYF